MGDDLSLAGHPEVFVIGDLAAAHDPRTGAALPGLAPVAIQAGTYVARIIAREVTGRGDPARRPRFLYRDKGTLATIGRRKAVADVFGHHVSGTLAWLLWSGVHIATLVTFRTKVFVLINWVWNYFFFSKGARLITGSPSLRLTRVRSTASDDRPPKAR